MWSSSFATHPPRHHIVHAQIHTIVNKKLKEVRRVQYVDKKLTTLFDSELAIPTNHITEIKEGVSTQPTGLQIK
jgi:hypothetical protein